jgi:hypothetical protein
MTQSVPESPQIVERNDRNEFKHALLADADGSFGNALQTSFYRGQALEIDRKLINGQIAQELDRSIGIRYDIVKPQLFALRRQELDPC